MPPPLTALSSWKDGLPKTAGSRRPGNNRPDILWRWAGWSLKKIAEELNRRGVPTQQGSQWHVSTVRDLLQNSLYWEVAQDGQTFDPGRGGGNSRR